MSDGGWKLVYEGFDPAREGLREALCALGNGYFATRGAAEETEADDVHYPGTYLAGGYNRLQTDIAGRQIENEDLVNLPNWLPLTFRPEDGDWLNLRRVELLEYRQELDLERGLLERRLRVRDAEGRETSLASRRLVHMGLPHLAAMQVTLRPENWSGVAVVRTALDGRVINSGVERYRQLNNKHLVSFEAGTSSEDAILLIVETNQSRLRIAEAARTRLCRDGKPLPVERQTFEEDGFVGQELTFEATEGKATEVEKVVALFTSRDRAISEPRQAAIGAIENAENFDRLLDSHVQAWRTLWDRCDIRLDGQAHTQMILRLHIFHLLQTVSPNTSDLDVGVPARGLHGEAYRGHIFWDELFILPFLNFHLPEIARGLLLYRFRRLPAARRLAHEAGYGGAMYPWQSGSSGREESQVLHLNPRSGRWTPDNTHLQRHVSAAIAYNVWRYWQATGDREFLSYYGAEMLVEIARFWASIASYNENLGRYEIRGVMGPDEFHDRYPWREEPGLDNNAYTNVMAAWVLRRAVEALGFVGIERRRELEDLLALRREETSRWDDISRRMRLVFLDGRIIAQFEGYDRLEELDWDAYRSKYSDIQRLDRILEAEGDTINRYKASKQADVLMLFYLFSYDELQALITSLGYPFEPDVLHENIAYYVQRTSDGSTLSRVVHSWVLARSDRARSWSIFVEALESDVADIQGGTTPEGIHLGAMAGTVDLVERGQTALEFRDDALWINPCLPTELQGLRMKLLYRGYWLYLDINCDRLILSAPNGWGGPSRIGVRNQVHSFKAGDVVKFDCHVAGGGWRPATATRRLKKVGARASRAKVMTGESRGATR
ncbi:MAG TPA: glycosyl hydrolase family 65 protein [Alphaproteobacteria bacterium]|nr:glycosyl hydrolase family 65 protein [Alphaproteobacteria bacterium]